MNNSERALRIVLIENGGYWTANCIDINLCAEARGKLDALAKLHEILLIRASLSRRLNLYGPSMGIEASNDYKSRFKYLFNNGRTIHLTLPDGVPGVFVYDEVREYNE